MAASEKKYTEKDLKEAFLAGKKCDIQYKGGGVTEVKPIYDTFEAYLKTKEK